MNTKNPEGQNPHYDENDAHACRFICQSSEIDDPRDRWEALGSGATPELAYAAMLRDLRIYLGEEALRSFRPEIDRHYQQVALAAPGQIIERRDFSTPEDNFALARYEPALAVARAD